jgi:hypothetical protein
MSKTLSPLVALAMLGMLVVIASGCGTGSSGGTDTGAAPAATGSSAGTTTAPAGTGSSGGNSNVTAREKAVEFAECMRANGVSAFPDPDASGELTIDGVVNGSSLDTSTVAWKTAISACRDLQPPGFTGTEVSPEKQEVRLKFAQCMRDNGIKDFPDPTANGPLIDTSRMPGSPGALSIPGFKAAQEKCSDVFKAALPDASGDQ